MRDAHLFLSSKEQFVALQRVNCVKFNQPDSTVIISDSYDATIRCWDCRSRSAEPIQIIDDAKGASGKAGNRNREQERE